MVLIATPFSIQRVRSGGAARGIALSLVIAAAYWALTSSGRALGLSGAMPPVQAAWLANVVFAVLAAAAIFRIAAAGVGWLTRTGHGDRLYTRSERITI